jgi:predicted Zn finger-like uncharacterized protein
MIVQCENCSTKFNLPEEQIKPDGSWVRCSRCQEVFQVLPPQPSGEPEAPPEPAETQISLDLEEEAPGRQDEAEELADFNLTQTPAAAGKGPGKLFKAFFWLLGIGLFLALVAVGAVVALDRLGAAPEVVERFRALPGAELLLSGGPAGTEGQDQPGEIRMALSNVRGYFRLNDQVGRLFVIQGLVENHHQGVRTAVLVRGRLQDAQGQVVRQAVVYAGPTFTPEELQQLSLNEMQARLGSPRGPDGINYVVAPEGTIPFMIVFANLPGNLAEFSAEVVGSDPLGEPTPAGR